MGFPGRKRKSRRKSRHTGAARDRERTQEVKDGREVMPCDKT